MEFEANQVYVRRREQLRARLSRADYRAYYAALMDLRAEFDPRAAVGGLWQEMGTLVFEYLVSAGLRPDDRFLDIGCGALRIGRHVIAFLDVGHYAGIDISEGILRAAGHVIEEEGLVGKAPRLGLNQDLRFSDFSEASFEVVLAQSVMTHLPEIDLRECLGNVRRILAPGGKLHATFFLGTEAAYAPEHEVFVYPYDLVEAAAAAGGLSTTIRPEFIHPRGQTMISFQPL